MDARVRSSMRLSLIACALLCVAIPARAQDATAKDPWASLRFLLGNWAGMGSGKPGEAISGATSFALELGQNVIVRRNRAEYPPRDGRGGSVVHEDLMIIYLEPGRAQASAIYFDNEGHTIQYAETASAKPGMASFESSAAGQGPRFKLVYELLPDEVLAVEFAIAAAGKPFQTYTRGLLKRAK